MVSLPPPLVMVSAPLPEVTVVTPPAIVSAPLPEVTVVVPPVMVSAPLPATRLSGKTTSAPLPETRLSGKTTSAPPAMVSEPLLATTVFVFTKPASCRLRSTSIFGSDFFTALINALISFWSTSEPKLASQYLRLASSGTLPVASTNNCATALVLFASGCTTSRARLGSLYAAEIALISGLSPNALSM